MAPATLKGQTFLTLPGDRWKLLWNDEFDGVTLDTSKWSHGLPWRGDDGTNRHHNSQYASVITDEDAQVRGGMLHLTSQRKEVPNPKGGTYHFTEGLITTSGKFATGYGYFEMRALLPTEAGPGTWPAFWMLSEGWPPEMDVLEYWGSNNRIHQGTVTRKPDGGQRWDSYHQRQVSLKGWHTYGLEWGPGYQIYNMDGKVTNRIYGPHLPDGKFYLLLNSGVESQRPPTPGTTFPNDYVVDYVRVYARPDGAPALLDAGFEDSDIGPWERVGEASVGDYGARSGTRCLRADPTGGEAVAGAKQTVYGLRPNTRYSVTSWARRVPGSAIPGTARMSVADAGTPNPTRSDARPLTDAYAPLTLTFTTGPSATSAVLILEAAGSSTLFDDVSITTEAK